MINLTTPNSKRKLIPHYIDPEDKKIYRWQISNQNSLAIKLFNFTLYFVQSSLTTNRSIMWFISQRVNMGIRGSVRIFSNSKGEK